MFIAECIREDKLSIFTGFKGDFMDRGGEEKEEVLGEKEVDKLVLLFW